MLSNRVHKALLTFQDDEAAETAKFEGMFDKFFDCLKKMMLLPLETHQGILITGT